jgi:16S rRNA (cytidine1402-2'-O)-methyltransferase
LLDAYEIRTPMLAYHEHNEARMTPTLVERLKGGESFALVSDAGTPLLSDPGARLVSASVAAGVPVSPVPGASALLAALVAAGLDATRFTFYGFFPRRGRERADVIRDVTASRQTTILYEAPSRVAETLAELAGAGAADRDAAVARELTKAFEEIRRGTVRALAAYYAEQPARGEVVIVIGGRAADVPIADEAVRARANELRDGGATPRDVMRALVGEFGIGRNQAYRIAQETEDQA